MKYGGPPKVVTETLEYLTKNFEHNLIVFGTSNMPTINYQVCINPTFLNNRYGLRLRQPTRAAKKLIRDTDIILLHGFYLFSTLIGIYYSKTKTIFIMPHGSLEKYQEQKRRLSKSIFRILFRKLLNGRKINFLVASKSEADSILNIFPSEKVSVVGLGINNYSLNSDTDYEIHDPVVLYCLSRITKKKRIDLCIQAISELNKTKKKFRLDIFGSGEVKLEFNLKKLTKDLNLENYVKFRNFLDEASKSNVFSELDIFLLPSENENFAIAVAESISAGKPVIVSRHVAMHEFVDLHKTGLTINSLDVQEIINAINKISSNYRFYSRNCINSAYLLSWGEVTKNWVKVLKSSLEVQNDY
jgi:glycosyltransferase involved in cell wall biosynthesis